MIMQHAMSNGEQNILSGGRSCINNIELLAAAVVVVKNKKKINM